MRKFRETVKEMYSQGASAEEMDEIEIGPEDYNATLGWVLGSAGLTFLVSIILLIAGLVMRFGS